ncbi:MAG TPA: ornithine cyclodeaminase family protein [Solirubrobacteraceae bacterium]|jgi:ornithine cyclodeaminase|nr:ornithine cyclodeaminase family protein [Solirubrobacteraceae bacterium]
MRVLVLSHDDVRAALTPAACLEAMAEVLAAHARGEAYMPLRSIMRPPGAAGLMGLMPAWRGDGEGGGDPETALATFALKAICLMRGNPARGLDAHQGTVTLFDGETGRPTAILDASAITAVRTAAVTALATRVLARADATTLAIIGAGVQAAAHIEALLAVREFESVRVYAPTAEHVRAVIDGASGPGAQGVELSAAASAEEAVRGADVVVAVTSSPEPVIRHRWLGPGTHVNAVGASTLATRELEVETVAAAALFADSRESLRQEAGEYRLALEQGAISEDHVRAELGEVVAGLRPGRSDDGELTLFRSLGIAVEDLAAAEVAVAAARRLGRGTEVEL